MRARGWLLMSLLVAGSINCASVEDAIRGGAKPVEEPDEAPTWPGRGVDEVLTHPFFSTLERKEQPLTNGRMLTFRSCAQQNVAGRTFCTPIGNAVSCTERPAGVQQACCFRQFILGADDVVARYQRSGACLTGRRYMPVAAGGGG